MLQRRQATHTRTEGMYLCMQQGGVRVYAAHACTASLYGQVVLPEPEKQ